MHSYPEVLGAVKTKHVCGGSTSSTSSIQKNHRVITSLWTYLYQLLVICAICVLCVRLWIDLRGDDKNRDIGFEEEVGLQYQQDYGTQQSSSEPPDAGLGAGGSGIEAEAGSVTTPGITWRYEDAIDEDLVEAQSDDMTASGIMNGKGAGQPQGVRDRIDRFLGWRP